METTLRDERSRSPEEPLARLTELADVVMEAAALLQATAAAARGRGTRQDPAETAADPVERLISDLLSHESIDGAVVSRRAAALGSDLSLGALGLCVELSVPRPAFVGQMISEGCEEALVAALERGGRLRVYAILPCVGSCIAGSIGAVRALTTRISPYGIVGVSSFQADAGDLGPALREAELVIDVIRDSGEHVAEDVGTGTCRLLLRMLASHPAEVREFYEATIAPMVAYDRTNRTDLVTTLRAYLQCDCNMNTTAAKVYAHRHTVAARLERIRELTGLDPLHYEDREQLSMGLKAHRLLAPQLAAGQA